uniref:Prokaryotic-type class I peptide chain release factors domain-containing protein n=1 Tax=Parascaris univalens TaxID=6257 RepID=A0A915A4W9_PARUN
MGFVKEFTVDRRSEEPIGNLVMVSLRINTLCVRYGQRDVLQKFISGWGPGGQKVNTAQNAVMLKHIPTGIVVKVHESRLLSKNIEIAYERLKYALDRYVNKENCYEEQLKKLERAREEKLKRKRAALRQMKRELIE